MSNSVPEHDALDAFSVSNRRNHPVAYWATVLALCQQGHMPPPDCFDNMENIAYIPSTAISDAIFFAEGFFGFRPVGEGLPTPVANPPAPANPPASVNQPTAPPPANAPPAASYHGTLPIAQIFTANGDNFVPTYQATGQVQVVLAMASVRPIPWRANAFGRLKATMERERVVACGIASRGALNANDCRKCEAGTGPFNGCYSVAGFQGGGCANCKWDHKPRKCRHHGAPNPGNNDNDDSESDGNSDGDSDGEQGGGKSIERRCDIGEINKRFIAEKDVGIIETLQRYGLE